ncbi:MAG: hypothetical protein RIB98_09750 [Acidimicrobiales bacterium]
MRFVELRPTPLGFPLPLHPRITWLKGLDPASRVSVVGLVHDVALGLRPDWEGIIEIDGRRSDLGDTVADLGETADSALIIDAASLPEVPADPDLAGTRHQPDPAADRANLDAAQQKLAVLDERIAELAAEIDASGKVRAEMTANLTSALAQVETSAFDALDTADGLLGRAARLAGRPDPWTGMRDTPDRIAALKALVEEFDERLAALPTGDRPALAAAVATARAGLVTGSVPSPEAMALAQAWSSLHQRLRGLESRVEAAAGGTEAVATRLDEARAAARRAEDAAVPRKVTEQEAAELERLHDEMITAEQKAGRGVRRSAGRASFEEAADELQQALEPLGYPTWAAFRMGNGLAQVPDEVIAEYEQAQAALEIAETEWTMLMARIEQDSELQDVLTAIDRALEHAVELLGEDPLASGEGTDEELVMAALQAHRVDAASVGVARAAGVQHLRDALGTAGAAGHNELTSDIAIVALGDSWIQVLAAADELAVRLLRDRERAIDELQALELLGDGSRVDRLDGEREAVRQAEIAVARTRDALGQVVNARLRLHVLAATELSLAEEHDDRLVRRESAQVLVDLAARRVDGHADVDAAAALADRVPRGAAGPVPVVIVMGDSPAELLDRLVALPEDVQILVIGDGRGMDEWLAAVGPACAVELDTGTLV